VFITKLNLRNFRCFTDKTLSFKERFVVIEGNNGSGKTSLLEALHYACYLRSFRTRLHRNLVQLGDQDHFFLSVGFCGEDKNDKHSIKIGVSAKEKVVKLDEKPVKAYRDIVSRYRAISLCEDDLLLIQGSPEARRAFLDQSLSLASTDYRATLRTYRRTLQHRNALLMQGGGLTDQLKAWSQHIWEQSHTLHVQRQGYLAKLQERVNDALAQYYEEDGKRLSITFQYQTRGIKQGESFDQFWSMYQVEQLEREIAWKRTLFGAHLDDFRVDFEQKRARIFASRGQQKLVVFLIKLAQVILLSDQGMSCCLLLDDFLTDFDERRLNQGMALLSALPESCQVFITCPLGSLGSVAKGVFKGAQRISF